MREFSIVSPIAIVGYRDGTTQLIDPPANVAIPDTMPGRLVEVISLFISGHRPELQWPRHSCCIPIPTPAESRSIGTIGAPAYENASSPRVEANLIGATMRMVVRFEVLVIIGVKITFR